MPRLYPFKALRPDKKYVEEVSAKSTDFPSKDDLVREIQNNPHTFHHVTKGHLRYSGSNQSPEKFLPFASNYIDSMKSAGVLVNENEDSFYLYEQVFKNGNSIKGIIGLYAVEDYRNNTIKKHEEIRPNRLQYLVELFKTAKVLGEPTLLAYKGDISFEKYSKESIFSFESPDGKKHHVSKISSTEEVDKLSKEFEQIDSFYIADGHHRSASAEKFNHSSSKFNNDKTMCFVVAEDQLEIKPFHRLIKPVLSINKDVLITKLSDNFEVSRSYESLYDIKDQGNFGLYIDNEWYQLRYKNKNSDLLDVEIIEDYIIKNVFGIMDSRTDSQIAFHPYTNGEKEMYDLVNKEIYKIAITNKPCDFSDVRQISDSNKTLPPKSTYIEPKLRSGMIIQEF
ncbi:MAG: DUF1015 family protein [Bacteroidia bacterium]|nr:DUF1015 family protein [Bacteroidia bacterium]